MVDRHCLVTLPITINNTLKWLLSLPTLLQASFSVALGSLPLPSLPGISVPAPFRSSERQLARAKISISSLLQCPSYVRLVVNKVDVGDIIYAIFGPY